MDTTQNPGSDLPSLLVVDDEPELRSLLVEYFSRHGFAVREAQSALQARAAVAQARPCMAILDVNMLGENGLSLARWLRETHPGVAIVMLTTASETVERIVGLEMGADDYLSKPFEPRELLARVRAVLRRLQPLPSADQARPAAAASPASSPSPLARPAAEPDCVRFGDNELHLQRRKLLDPAGREIELTAGEFDLLALFARHPNLPLSREQIMSLAHNRDWDVYDRSIDLKVMRLRRKIERNPDKPELLKTVRNVGYVFVSKAVPPNERKAP